MMLAVIHSGRTDGTDSGVASPFDTTTPVSAVVDRQVRIFAVVLLVISAPSLGVSLYTSPPAVSHPQPDWAGTYYHSFEQAATAYNDRVEDLYEVEVWELDLHQARPILSYERVNVYVTDGRGRTAAYSFRLDGAAQIRDLKQGRRSDATVRVVVERSAIRRISTEYTQTRAVRAAFLRGDIRVTGVGASNWLRWLLIEHRVRTTVEGG